jgi:hypothetical protein
MINNMSKKNFNTKSITIKVDAVQSLDKHDRGYDKRDTEFKHDALQLLLNSPNPLRKDYNFDGDNEQAVYTEIAMLKKQMRRIMYDAIFLLKTTKKHEVDVIAEPKDEWPFTC